MLPKDDSTRLVWRSLWGGRGVSRGPWFRLPLVYGGPLLVVARPPCVRMQTIPLDSNDMANAMSVRVAFRWHRRFAVGVLVAVVVVDDDAEGEQTIRSGKYNIVADDIRVAFFNGRSLRKPRVVRRGASIQIHFRPNGAIVPKVISSAVNRNLSSNCPRC